MTLFNHPVKTELLSLLLISVLVSSCQQADETAPVTEMIEAQTTASANDTSQDKKEEPEATVIATINGKNISMSDFEVYVGRRMQEDPTAVSNPAAMLNELINKELLVQQAISKEIDKREDVVALVKQETEGILVSALVQEQLTGVDLSDETLRAEYDKQLSQMVLKEYKGRHILLASEEEATAVLKELSEGADFEELARTKSTGPSASKGGDLGWFQAESMVPAFAEEVKSLNNNEISKSPVKTRFGWHVIKLEDSRELDIPGFEESKDRLKAIIANQNAQEYLTGLRENASIDIKNPSTGDDVPVTNEQLDKGTENL